MTKYIAKTPDVDGNVTYTPEENETWKILMDRQLKVIQNRACDEYIHGLNILNMPHDRVPQCPEISAKLKACTGWSVAPVDAIIPLESFFKLLANRQFPAATFIRVRQELDYLQEPDIFHEFFGHCPMLTNQAYADFVQWYGEQALKTDKKVQSLLGRLFWFTIEFGLIKQDDQMRIYGGGILSSFTETVYALESDIPIRHEFNINKILNTPYRYDEIQKDYFVIKDLSDLFQLKSDAIITMVEQLVDHPQDKDFRIC
jgi:phenylalanine-4-hydroxylase